MTGQNFRRIVLFDGVCNLCNSTVDFVLSHDRENVFKFASLQSDAAKRLLKAFEYTGEPLTSLVLIEGDRIYLKSTAVLRIARVLGRPYSYAYAFILVPPLLRNVVYSLIASTRYRWFGKRSQCRIPDEKTFQKFLS